MTQSITNAVKPTGPKGSLLAMAATYCLGVFNDNYFKQAAMLLAVTAGFNHLQGWAAILFALPFIVFSAHGGWCADRFAKKRVVVLSKILELAAMIIGGTGLLFGSWPCILAMVFLMGLQSTFFSPSLNGSIPELYPKKSVPKINAILKLATTLAILAGIATAGISLDLTWFDTGNTPFGVLMVAVVAITVAAAGLAAGLCMQSRPAPQNTSSCPFPWFGPWNSVRDLVDICKDRQLLLAIVADTYFYFIASLAVLVINAIGLQQLGFSQTMTSLLSVALMLGVCVGSFLAARITTIKKWSVLLVPSSMGIAAGLLLAGLTADIPAGPRFLWLTTSLAIAGVAGGLFLIPVTSALQIRPRAEEKGRVLAAAGFASFCAILVSGLIYNLLEPYLAPLTLMSVLGGFAAIAALLFAKLTISKHSQKTLVGRALRLLLFFRYKIEVAGLENIKAKSRTGILFLPNHPALIDPVIVMSALHDRFSPRPLSAIEAIDKPIVRQAMKLVRPITLPDTSKKGRNRKEAIYSAMDEVVNGLKQGDNILLYPAGHLSRSGVENLGGNSGVEHIVRALPDVQIVLVRSRGLWGSSFSRASGKAPSIAMHLRTYLKAIICNLIFCIPKRKVSLEFLEDTVIPKLNGRDRINRHLENYYNENPDTNIHVPYYWWQGSTPRVCPEVSKAKANSTLDTIPVSLQDQVRTKISELVGEAITGNPRLAGDLGLDSLTIMELGSWLESEFGTSIDDLTALDTLHDCIMAAAGQLNHTADDNIIAPPRQWFEHHGKTLSLSNAETITGAFLDQANRHPHTTIIADRLAGTKTYRDLMTGIFALLPIIDRLPGKRIGIMLPASVSCCVVYLATLFSGKTPVMFNWTAGIANMTHGIHETGVTHIISAGPLCTKIEDQQDIKLSHLPVEWLYLDQLIAGLGTPAKLLARGKSYAAKHLLGKRRIAEPAAILFTSGSESRPKAVPLSNANIIANLRDFSQMLNLQDSSCLLGMLPPFHSLGLVGTMIMPLCLGLRTVYHANPTEAAVMAGIIEKFQVSTLIATPTFLHGILQVAGHGQLLSLRLAFTGAEKCPDHVLQKLRQTVPAAELCEGYGITECSPLVSINPPGEARPGTIGQILPSIEYAIVNEQLTESVPIGEQGLLLVRGPSIFSGYLNSAVTRGFCEFEGKLWYRTGDIVRLDAHNHLVFCGRLKRFIKIGGEMISLPAIENTLLTNFGAQGEAGPVLAVEATPVDGHPEIVLFTTGRMKREEVNRILKKAGLSALHNIRRLIEVDTIPVLGSGKTDYSLLQQMLVV